MEDLHKKAFTSLERRQQQQQIDRRKRVGKRKQQIIELQEWRGGGGGGGHEGKPEHDLAREPGIDYSKLTSFLVQEDSFLTPWNWSGNISKEKDDRSHSKSKTGGDEQRRLHFEPGSYFSYDLFNVEPESTKES